MMARPARPAEEKPIVAELARLLEDRDSRPPQKRPKRIDGDDGSDDELFDDVPV